MLLNKASTGESADMKRLRRLMQPRTDGSYLVPKEIVDKWMDVHGGGRDSVVNMWDASGSSKDRIWLNFTVYGGALMFLATQVYLYIYIYK